MLEVISDGWTVTNMDLFRLVAKCDPPRPGVYQFYLWADVTSWKPIAIWLCGTSFIAVGVAVAWWFSLPGGSLLIFLGALCFSFWLKCFRMATQDVRYSPAVVGIVETLNPHPLLRTCSTAMVLSSDGTKVPVAFPTQLVESIILSDGRAEMLFLHSPWSQFSLGLAARSVQAESDDAVDRPRQ